MGKLKATAVASPLLRKPWQHAYGDSLDQVYVQLLTKPHVKATRQGSTRSLVGHSRKRQQAGYGYSGIWPEIPFVAWVICLVTCLVSYDTEESHMMAK
jgi:hypothetical protein